MSSIVHINDISSRLRKNHGQDQSIGLVMGVFDIVHYGHVDLFRFAKKYVDRLIVSVDSDETVRLTKGVDRPLCFQHVRAQVLKEMRSVDYVCKLDTSVDYSDGDVDEDVNKMYDEVVSRIKPTALITNVLTDRYWENRKKRAERLGLRFIPQRSVVFTGSSSSLMRELLKQI